MNDLPTSSLRRTVAPPQKSGLNIGLHAQTLERAHGVVAGSEITTLGLKRAFEKRDDVNWITRYGPGNCGSIDTDDLDLLIIEGWDATLPQFIQRVRESHSRITILFWNLSFLGIKEIVRLNVDGYLTNSRKVVQILEGIAPTKFVMLAANPDEFKPVEPEDRYSHNVTYLGMFHPGKPPAITERMLCEAMDYGLAIYGNGWDHHPVLSSYWNGTLPMEDIAKLYSSVKIVLGMTEDRQKAAGMINNRVFEALSCGACFISEYYPALEEVFGDMIRYSRKKGDTSSYIGTLLGDAPQRRTLGARGRELVLKHHTYDRRVEAILDFYWHIRG